MRDIGRTAGITIFSFEGGRCKCYRNWRISRRQITDVGPYRRGIRRLLEIWIQVKMRGNALSLGSGTRFYHGLLLLEDFNLRLGKRPNPFFAKDLFQGQVRARTWGRRSR